MAAEFPEHKDHDEKSQQQCCKDEQPIATVASAPPAIAALEALSIVHAHATATIANQPAPVKISSPRWE